MYAEPSDIISERAVLAGILRHSGAAYIEVVDILNDRCFVDDSHNIIYSLFHTILSVDPSKKLDIATVLSTANELGLTQSYFDTESKIRYLRSLANYDVDISNVRPQAQKLRKLLVARDLRSDLDLASKSLANIGGTESMNAIIAQAEEPIYKTINSIQHNNTEIIRLGDTIDDFFQNIEENRNASIGIQVGFPEWEYSIGGGLRRGTVGVIGARSKGGKALRNGSLVYTPSGPVSIENLKVGDLVCNTQSGYSKVTGVFPQGRKRLYRIHFKYGSYIDCSEDHLWKIWYKRRNKWEVLSLRDIIDHGMIREKNCTKWYIPLTKPVQFNEANLPIPPYLFGVLIGDGTLGNNNVSITNADKDIINKCRKELKPEYYLNNRVVIQYYIIRRKKFRKIEKSNFYMDQIRNLKLDVGSHDKFIPEIYKYCSLEQRLELIRGLMDTDGSAFIQENNSVALEYTTVSEKLAKDFQWLIQSIGGLCSIKERYTSYTGSNKKFRSYRLHIHMDDPTNLFYCKRKKKKCKLRTKPSLKRSISKIEPLGKDYCTCISVDSPDKLFLTDDFIVTHNTTLLNVWAKNICDQGIPIFNCDTEMKVDDHNTKMAANIAGIKINEIESGKFLDTPISRKKVDKAKQSIKDALYYYSCIAGKPFDETISIMRRWIARHVGFESNGMAKPCVIFYDYLKIMDSSEIHKLQEYQILGLQMTKLHNFAVQYGVPIVTFVQLNRDGLSSEESNVIAGSDRILWLCSHFTILKQKSEEEIQSDGVDLGNRKLVVNASRHGPGHQFPNYIHLAGNLSQGRFVEMGSTERPLKKKVDFELDDTTIEF